MGVKKQIKGYSGVPPRQLLHRLLIQRFKPEMVASHQELQHLKN